ncbi:vWA domain-containing protein [Gaiella sp.]|uniref:vWA domain-containing protein n=1 Tax=Gaiella sp. TaxID=2663207 RepID=UPI0032679D51
MSVFDSRLRTPGLPTSATAELGSAYRRTRLLRLTLAFVALVLLGTSFALARSLESLPTTYFATGSGGIVVLDLSTSVDVQKAQRAQRVLRSLAETDGRVGLVVFSDSAYEMLPPDTRSSELEPLLPFFRTGPQISPDVRRTRGGRIVPNTPSGRPRESPWSLTFRGGTRISTGLVEARRIIEREGDRRLSVLLVSDLDNSGFDTSDLTEELGRYEQAGIDLKVIPLFPGPDDRELFVQLVGKESLVARPEILRNTDVQERQSVIGSFPWALAAIGAALLLLLAINERLCGRLVWGAPR